MTPKLGGNNIVLDNYANKNVGIHLLLACLMGSEKTLLTDKQSLCSA
jgi:hypothetical protein